jgi:membrane-associated protease RseP (regulator of RpoE activity)
VLRVAIFTLLLTLPCLCQELPLRAPGTVTAQIQFPVEANFGEDLPAGSTAHLLVLGDEHWRLAGSLSAKVIGRTANFPTVSLNGERGRQGSIRLVAVVLLDGRTLSVSSEPIAVGAAPLPSVTFRGRPFGGIGLHLSQEGDRLLISETTDGLPAHRAGLREGDRVESVDGKNVHGLNLEQVASLLQGAVGTPVNVVVSRGRRTTRQFTLERTELYRESLEFQGIPSQRDRVPFQISILVTDDAGLPLPGAQVTITMDPEYRTTRILFINSKTFMGDASGLLADSLSAVTGEDGRATLWVKLSNNATPYDFRFLGVANWGQATSRSIPSNVFTVYDNP